MLSAALLLACGWSALAARTSERMSGGWEFSRDGGRFSPVRVPHDWAIAGPFDPLGDGDTGKLPWKGRGVYRRTIVLAEKPRGRMFLDFDGVMMHATVFVNGEPCGRGDYGYLGFRVDATPYLMAGTNTVEVRCDTDNFKSRWYPGGGMYRNAFLVTTDAVHLEDDSVRVETFDVLKGTARLVVGGVAANRLVTDAPVAVSLTLSDPAGKTVAAAEKALVIPSYDKGVFELETTVANPVLWEMRENAALYRLRIALKGGGMRDEIERRIGFREFRFDPEKGFVLNGRRVQLKGVNLHSDLGPLGMAVDRDAIRRQLSVMRDMGANAIRTSHNCPAPELLDLCDEMGFFVWNECFDKWNETTGRGDEPLESFVSRTLAAWVRRDRVHPCVFAWSIGNEISPGNASPPGQENWSCKIALGTSAERCARFRHVVRTEDRTRPVSIGSCFDSAVSRGDYDALDLTGWNYGERYSVMKARHPDAPVLYTESASALSEYGFYAERLPTNKTDFAWTTKQVDSRDLNAASWSDISDREFFRMERDRYCGGEFVWTGIDYLGEPTPYEQLKNPLDNSRSSSFGICDLCVFPKDRFYLYRSHWNREDFTLHLVPDHWTFPQKVGKTLPVFVYTSADEAELFLNGRSLGRRRKQKDAGSLDDYYSVLPRYRLVWRDVPYETGEIKVVAYGADGKALGEECHRTAGEPAGIRLKAGRRYGDLQVFEVFLVDRNGTRVANDNRKIRFSATGACRILAVGNSDPRGYESFMETGEHSLRYGRAAVYLGYCGKTGAGCCLTAESDGLESAQWRDPGSAADGAFAAEPVRMILDTDMYTDYDDVGAIAMLHALAVSEG